MGMMPGGRLGRVRFGTGSPHTGDVAVWDGKRWARLPAPSGVGNYLLRSPGGLAVPAWIIGREVLTADRTYYVRTDGSDSNTGLVNSSGGAFLTTQRAWNVAKTIDCNGFSVIIQHGDGTYANNIALDGELVGGTLIVRGNSGSPTAVVLSGAPVFQIRTNTTVTLENFRVSGSSVGLNKNSPGGILNIGTGMSFAGNSSFAMINAGAGRVNLTGPITIASSANCWLYCQLNGVFFGGGQTITFTGTPAWTTAGIIFESGGQVSVGSSAMSGAATGKRYQGNSVAALNSAGAGTASTYFPGNVDGTVAGNAVQT